MFFMFRKSVVRPAHIKWLHCTEQTDSISVSSRKYWTGLNCGLFHKNEALVVSDWLYSQHQMRLSSAGQFHPIMVSEVGSSDILEAPRLNAVLVVYVC